ncbi:MAG: monovalent cation/H+ antiporter complex subunit F [Desulfohalobiaceae bacterium]
MEHFYLALALFLFLNIVAGLLRIFLGPTPADRMLTAQLFGTTGTAILLLLAEALHHPPVRDVALILVLLSLVAVVSFVRRIENSDQGGDA